MEQSLLLQAHAQLGEGGTQADTLEAQAYRFARDAHGAIDHRRKHSGEPYLAHLAEVANLVRTVDGHTQVQLAASWLHDVREDTPTSDAQLRAEFGDAVADLVDQLTDVSTPEDGNRAARKAIDRQHSAVATAAAQTVKVADISSNCRNIAGRDPAFARLYLEEKSLQLQMLTLAEASLSAHAAQIIEEAMRQLSWGTS